MKSIRVKFNFLLIVVFSSGALFGYKAYLEYKGIEAEQRELSQSLSLRNKITALNPDEISPSSLASLQKLKRRMGDSFRRMAVSNLIQAYTSKNPRLFQLRMEELEKAERDFYKAANRKINTFKSEFKYYVTIALFLPFIGFGILSYYFNFKIAAPLDKLSKRMMEFLIDQYTFRFSNPANNEIGNMERTFNSLAQKVLNNIDELKALDRAKSEFVSIASHELRTPLTSIKGSLGMLSAGIAGEMDEEAADLVAVANRETDRLVRLINELLDLAKIESRTFDLKLDWVPMEEIVTRSIESLKGFATSAKVHLVQENSEIPVAAYLDRDRIQQVITNLVSNAIKYSPEGETVTLRIEVTNQRNLYLSVTDNGPGISEDNQALIFEKFRQATNSSTPLVKGTGLGLAISKALIEEHGGEIGIESKLGEGSSFYIVLKEWKEMEVPVDPEVRSQSETKVAA